MGSGAFIFINNYERFANLSAKKDVQLEACGVKLPRLTIPAGTMAILPVNIDGIRYATAQLVARRDGKLYLMQVKGLPTTIALASGKTLKNVKPRGTARPVYDNMYLLTQEEAEHLFLHEESDVKQTESVTPSYSLLKPAGPLRTVSKGRAKVAAAPTEADWQQAAVYQIDVTALDGLLRIDYRGDCARLYADGKLIADNFYNGRPFLYGLWRLPKNSSAASARCTLELHILPLQPDAPIYLPREADKTAGVHVKNIEITAKE
jgi:hypothetical protein